MIAQLKNPHFEIFARCNKYANSYKENYRIFFLFLQIHFSAQRNFPQNFLSLFLPYIPYRFQSRLPLFVRFICYVILLLYLNYSLLKFMNTRCNDQLRSDSRGCWKKHSSINIWPISKDIKKFLLKLQTQMPS